MMNINIRSYKKKDEKQVKCIFAQYWADDVFLNELSEKLDISGKAKSNTDTYRFYVAENNGEIVGIAGLRKAPDHLSVYADTGNPVELYVIASKIKKMGIGEALEQKIIKEAKELGFTEMLCYSPETHSSSWSFYEKLHFKKHGMIVDPDDGYPGMLWKKLF